VIDGDEVVVWKPEDQAATEFGLSLCETANNSPLCTDKKLFCKGLFVLELTLFQRF